MNSNIILISKYLHSNGEVSYLYAGSLRTGGVGLISSDIDINTKKDTYKYIDQLGGCIHSNKLTAINYYNRAGAIKIMLPEQISSFKFGKKTSQGWKVLYITEIRDNLYYDAIVERPVTNLTGPEPNKLGQYVVCTTYNANTGEWGQGLYDNKTIPDAILRLKKYNGWSN